MRQARQAQRRVQAVMWPSQDRLMVQASAAAALAVAGGLAVRLILTGA